MFKFILILAALLCVQARVTGDTRTASDEVVFHPNPPAYKHFLATGPGLSVQECVTFNVDRNEGNILYPEVDDNSEYLIFDHAHLIMDSIGHWGPDTIDLEIDGTIVTGYKAGVSYIYDLQPILHDIGEGTRSPIFNVCATTWHRLYAKNTIFRDGPELTVKNRPRIQTIPEEWKHSILIEPNPTDSWPRSMLDVPTNLAYYMTGVCDESVKQIWAYWGPNPADKVATATQVDEMDKQQDEGENMCFVSFDGYGHGDSLRTVGDSSVADPIPLYSNRSFALFQAAIEEVLFPLVAASEYDAVIDLRLDEWHSTFAFEAVALNPPGSFRRVDQGTPGAQDGPEENVAKCSLAPPGTPGSSFSNVLEMAATSVGLGGAGVGAVWCDISEEYNGPAILGPDGLNDPLFNDAANGIRSEGLFSRRGPLPWSLDTIQAALGVVLPGASYDLAFFAGLNVDNMNTTVVVNDPVNGPITQGDIDAFINRCVAKSGAGGFGNALGQQELFSSSIWSDAERTAMDEAVNFDGFGTSDTAKIFAACSAAAPGSTGPSPIKSPNRFQAFGATVSSNPDALLGPGFTVGDLEDTLRRYLSDRASEFVQDPSELAERLSEGGVFGVIIPSTHFGHYVGDSGTRQFPYMTWVNGRPIVTRFDTNGFDRFQGGNAGGHIGLAKNAADLYAYQHKQWRQSLPPISKK